MSGAPVTVQNWLLAFVVVRLVQHRCLLRVTGEHRDPGGWGWGGRGAVPNRTLSPPESELGSCVKVEVAVQGSPSQIVLIWSLWS